MKKLTILVILISTVGMTYAQTSKGYTLLGGGGSLWFQTLTEEGSGGDSKYNSTMVELMPMAGFFIADGMAVGGMIQLSMDNEVEKDDPDFYNKSMAWSIGPFFRYYHSSDFFGQAIVKFGGSNSKFGFGPGSEGSNEFSIFGWEAGIGKAIFFNEFVALEPMIIFASTKYTNKDDAGFPLSNTYSGPGLRFNFIFYVNK